MGATTTIEWTDATWNPVGGCSVKSPGCKPCYAMQLAGTRLATHPLYAGTTTLQGGRPVFNGTLTAAADDAETWSWPVRWRGSKTPKLGPGKPSLIFVGDMSDLTHENRPRVVIDRAIAGIVYSRHIGQLLTKRPDVLAGHLLELERRGCWFDFVHPLLGKPNFAPETTFDKAVLPRLWCGASAERQPEFDQRWPHLRRLAERGFTVFISYEPALGPLHLPDDFLALGKRAQVIAGGVSGRWPWAPHPDWFRHVRDQCTAAGVAFFFKQWGEWAPTNGSEEDDVAVFADGGTRSASWLWRADENERRGVEAMRRVGKAAAGALLDGREWREFPS